MEVGTLLEPFIRHGGIAIGLTDFSLTSEGPRFLFVSDALAHLFDCDADAVVGLPVDSFFPDAAKQDFRARLDDLPSSPASRSTLEVECHRRSGARFRLGLDCALVDDPANARRILCLIYREIDAPGEALPAGEPAPDYETLVAEHRRMHQELAQARARLESALDAHPGPFVIYDKNMRLVTCNAAYRRSMGSGDDFIRPGLHVREVLHHAIDRGLKIPGDVDADSYIDKILERDNEGKQIEDLEFEGDIHHRVFRSRAQNGDRLVLRMDTTELVRSRREAAEMRDRLISALNAYPAPFVIYDKSLRLVLYNTAYVKAFTDDPNDITSGMALRDVVETGLRNGRFAEAVGREEDWLEQMMDDAEALRPMQDIELSGDIHHRILRSRSSNGDLVMVRIDTTELVRRRRQVEEYARRLETANEAISRKAMQDDLTGLGNRRYLSQRLEEMIGRRKIDGTELAALHLDLDRFKQINDTMGHQAGDHVIRDAAARIQSHMEDGEVVARIGGDEFVMLVPCDKSGARAEALAELLVKEMARPSSFEGRECRFGASVGVAHTPLSDEASLLTNSDVALYKAKRSGRGRVGFFSREDFRDLLNTKHLADDILRGLERSEFVPYYQPQVDAATGRIVGLEALARWLHPERGLLAPDAFLSVAGDLGVLPDIDSAIFETAIGECREAFASHAAPPGLSFNASEHRIAAESIPGIARLVASYPGEVAFELLETIHLEELDESFMTDLDALRAASVSIEIDDFGSGRASIVALQKIAPDRLKIDRRLIAPISQNEGARQLVGSIVDIGRSLGIKVTAEGVETRAQAEILADLGCDRLQGFHFFRPMELRDVLRFMTSGGTASVGPFARPKTNTAQVQSRRRD